MKRLLCYAAMLFAAAASAWADEMPKVKVQLGWIGNVQYGEHYIALEDGLFKKHGIDVTVSPGGPNAPSALTSVAAGDADIGFTGWLPFLDAVAKGNDYVLIAAQMQVSPLGIISLKDKPILKPQDLVGSKILAQGPNEKTAIEATLSLAGLPKDQWTQVPAGFSPEPLLSKAGDGYTGFATNQVITLEQMGLVKDKDFYFRSFDDLGFKGYAGIAFTSRKYLDEHRDRVVAYLEGVIEAWQKNEKDFSYAPKLIVEKYGADYGLDIQQQTRQNEVQAPYYRPGGDPDFPIYSIKLDYIAGPMMDAARATGRTDLPEASKIAAPDLALEALANLKKTAN
ncbi:ABC transporter substrate-binding protein [Rhizobium sp. YS-1r]|uniref:ABC transporter substrate-binding protein n=1 Tax=Rhizobium sp. YS-1r TaxID=1532558 RepID=UPI00050F9DF7|nr:ABC transporter substrate-binding protein [Rhizobium sp. YS-1r]KGE00177.1 twin-arginine translocation pathway signal protein [Rhizobium sp. YS-1r]